MILKAVEENDDLRDNLSAAAHLIHGSPEDRFTVTYCPGHISREEIEGVGFNYGDLAEMSSKYDISNEATVQTAQFIQLLEQAWRGGGEEGQKRFSSENIFVTEVLYQFSI